MISDHDAGIDGENAAWPPSSLYESQIHSTTQVFLDRLPRRRYLPSPSNDRPVEPSTSRSFAIALVPIPVELQEISFANLPQLLGFV
jgi:hypothetical protein